MASCPICGMATSEPYIDQDYLFKAYASERGVCSCGNRYVLTRSIDKFTGKAFWVAEFEKTSAAAAPIDPLKMIYEYQTKINNKKLSRIEIPEGTTEIRSSEYKDCIATEIIIPNGVDRICNCAFSDCFSVKELHIPSSVRWVSQTAFYGWRKYQKIYVNKKNSKKWEKGWNKSFTVRTKYYKDRKGNAAKIIYY